MKRTRGFSLVETILALGVFAAGVLTLMGLLSPMIGSIEELAERTRADRVRESVSMHLSQQNFEEAFLPRLVPLSALPALSDTDERSIFVSRDGARVGTSADADSWMLPRKQDSRYYEVVLIRGNKDLDRAKEVTWGIADYFLEISWPARDSVGNTIARPQRRRLIVATVRRR